jgi:ADP-heptose:LPS heptosyltransferase
VDQNQAQHLIAQGNTFREQHQPEQALECYAAAMVGCRSLASAFNNYGNVLREVGDPVGAIPFLLRAMQLDPSMVTAHFNVSVAQLLAGDWANGFRNYESRFNYEHLAGTLPNYTQPRWTGQDLKDKTILILGEQGHGDNIQFVRFLFPLHEAGARIVVQTNDNILPLLQHSTIINELHTASSTPEHFDYWIPIMSLAHVLGVTVDTLPHQLQYLSARSDLLSMWSPKLGVKNKLRVGFCWSGRPDSWINQHKAIPFEIMRDFIKRNPEFQWINLQVECSQDERQQLEELGVVCVNGLIRNFADTAALMHHLDVVIGVDTAISHLGGALGKPTWILLNQYATDWRWLLGRDDSPWYPSVRLFRQPVQGDWITPISRIEQHLKLFKI